MKELINSWQLWAGLAACFAALTAIFAKVGVANINSDFATFIRTIIILVMVWIIMLAKGAWESPGTIPAKTWYFLILSGLATGASWLCYFRALKIGEAAKVAPIDKLSVVVVAVFGAAFLGEKLTIMGWMGVVMIGGGAALIAWKG
ncbi:EamA family transporter [Thalassospira sp. MA62]|nr:EamA family transporter [Thalassospira sp. MA62]